MPELPEVEVLRRKLERVIKDKVIQDVEIYDPAKLKGIKPELLKGESIISVGRRGKHLYFDLSSGKKLVFHLRLRGKLVYGEDSDELAKPWIALKFRNGKSLFFGDPRRMATLELVKDLNEIKTIAGMGPEPLDDSFTLDDFKRKVSNTSKKIKALLMDQSFVAGIGNVYADEILYRAGIHPERSAKTLSASEIDKLYFYIKDVLSEALEHNGVGEYTSLSVDDSEIGDYEKYLKVHGREGSPCPRCGTKIIKIKVGRRGTYLCPKCQL